MSRNYKFHNAEGAYLISFADVDWIDFFLRNEYKDILLEALSFCQQNKGMEVFAWCIMSNHEHLVFRSVGENKPENILGDFSRFTSRKIIQAIIENQKESRKEWMFEHFKKAAGQSSNVSNYQFWRHDNKPIELWSNEVISEKINYLHNNPVEDGLVFRAEDYVYSSAKDYCGEKGLLNDVIVVDV